MTESNGQQDLTSWAPRELLGNPQLHALDAYKKAIELPMLSPAEQRHLAQLIQAKQWAEGLLADEHVELSEADHQALIDDVARGDRALRVLVARHLPKVLATAKGFSYSKDGVLELASVGNLELVEAAASYRVVEGASFAAFAATVARNAISGYVQREKDRLTGLSRGMREMLADINQAHEAALSAGDEIGFLEVADFLGYETQAVLDALRLKNTETVSLDSTITVNDTLTVFADTLEDESASLEIEAVVDKVLLEKAWSAARTLKKKDLMSDREWQIFVMRFRDGMSQRAIAEVIGIAQTGISDYEEKIVAMIKQAVEDPDSLVLPRISSPEEVKKPIHLLALLGISVNDTDEAMAGAARLINNTPALTEKELVVINRLLGMDGVVPATLTELAKEYGVTVRSVCLWRNKAITKIVMAYWAQRAKAA